MVAGISVATEVAQTVVDMAVKDDFKVNWTEYLGEESKERRASEVTGQLQVYLLNLLSQTFVAGYTCCKRCTVDVS